MLGDVYDPREGGCRIMKAIDFCYTEFVKRPQDISEFVIDCRDFANCSNMILMTGSPRTIKHAVERALIMQAWWGVWGAPLQADMPPEIRCRRPTYQAAVRNKVSSKLLYF